jgi:Fe-S cluster assembly protein SufD
MPATKQPPLIENPVPELQHTRFLKQVQQYLLEVSAKSLESLPAWKALESLGFPHRHLESWRFVDLSSLLHPNLHWTLTTPESLRPSDTGKRVSPGARVLRFSNGTLTSDKALQLEDGVELELLPVSEAYAQRQNYTFVDGMEALTECLAPTVYKLRIREGVKLTKPLVLELDHSEQETPTLQALLLDIDVEAHAKLDLLVRHVGITGTAPYFAPYRVGIRLGKSAQMSHYRLAEPSERSFLFNQTRVVCPEPEAQYHYYGYQSGGALQRLAHSIQIQAPEVHVSYRSLNLLANQERVHLHVQMDHEVGESQSHQLVKAIVTDEARSEFEGRIQIFKNAQQTEARQLNKNLLLSAQAKAYARPWLQIDADDVSCAHGATVGQLSEEELFYFLTRGIPKAEAEAALVQAFARDVFCEALPSPLAHYALDTVGRRLKQWFLPS